MHRIYNNLFFSGPAILSELKKRHLTNANTSRTDTLLVYIQHPS